ncbi:hypothetical protein GCM10008959_35850 [Deinococcus seoulensis]|uniref:Uncharacterized protein n=1 Tax=Deinococcus seoulensis TaxID=1837379 RepID=A0ABQ2RXA1_9DEIO|nr:hypothetical protein GCM10008959_35850 [Deinococcus seoulensis]
MQHQQRHDLVGLHPETRLEAELQGKTGNDQFGSFDFEHAPSMRGRDWAAARVQRDAGSSEWPVPQRAGDMNGGEGAGACCDRILQPAPQARFPEDQASLWAEVLTDAALACIFSEPQARREA